MTVPLLAVASLHFTLAPIAWGLWAMGRTGQCPLDMVMEIPKLVERQNKIIHDLRKASSRGEPDGAGLVHWKTPYGDFWAPAGTPVAGLLSEQLVRFYGDGDRRVQPGDVVLDCGANIGTFVWEALAAGASKVVAIEPSPRNIEALHRNFADEIEAGKVVVYPKGVWNAETVLKFYSYENSALDSAVMDARAEDAGEKPSILHVPVTTIDLLVRELGLERVDFIKMDVEGADLETLEGARKTIGEYLPSLAVATENYEEDQIVLPKWIHAEFPAYHSKCGRCSSQDGKVLQAEAFYFFVD